MSKVSKRTPLIDAKVMGTYFLQKYQPYIIRGTFVGSIRREEKLVHDIDLLVEIDADYHKLHMDLIKAITLKKAEWYRGGDKMMSFSNVMDTGVPMQVFVSYPPRNYIALLALRTGPAADTIALKEGLKANGFPRPYAELQVDSERQLYEMAGIPFVPPEKRKEHYV